MLIELCSKIAKTKKKKKNLQMPIWMEKQYWNLMLKTTLTDHEHVSAKISLLIT